MIITFEELRTIKHQLPTGSVRKMAKILNLKEQTIRNYFGGTDFERGSTAGIHIQQGINGGYVSMEDTTIFFLAKELIQAAKQPQSQTG